MSVCDACRRRRIKCNRLQPCNRCLKSNIACTFGESEAHTSISYVRRLEHKVAELESLVEGIGGHKGAGSLYSPSDLRSPDDSDPESRQRFVDLLVSPRDLQLSSLSPGSRRRTSYTRYYGGINFLLVIGDECGGPEARLGRGLVSAMFVSSPLPPSERISILPTRRRALKLATVASRTALLGHDCIDEQELGTRLQRLYDVEPEQYDDGDTTSLALVFAILALGVRYSQPGRANESPKERGLTYFRASRKFLDRTRTQPTLDSVRTQILQMRFLLSQLRVHSAHRVLCRAVSDALQLGLHLCSQNAQDSFTEREWAERRRVFSVLYMMDTYIAMMLGLPRLLLRVDAVQTIGLPDGNETDEDDNEDQEAFRSPTGGKNAAIAAASPPESILFQRLWRIGARVQDLYYTRPDPHPHAARVDPEALLALQATVEAWLGNLPPIPSSPGSDSASASMSTHNHLYLRLLHAVLKIILYRPLLHHLARPSRDPRFSLQGYEFASSCVQAAMQVVVLVEAIRSEAERMEANSDETEGDEMDVDENGDSHRGGLNEAVWLYTYALAFARAVLMYFVSFECREATVVEARGAAGRADGLLALLGRKSEAAKRVYELMSPLA